MDPVTFQIRGLEGLAPWVKGMPALQSRVLEQILRTVKTRVQAATPVGIKYVKAKRGKGYQRKKGVHQGRWKASGALKRSWAGEKQAAAVSVYTDVEYAPILEGGLYPGIGELRYGMMPGGVGQVSPRTIAEGGKIFSSRAVGGILSPLLRNQTFTNSITELVINEVVRGLRRIK